MTGQTAIIEPERDNERFLERPFLGPIERVAKFGVKPPRSFDSAAGEAGDEVIGDADSPVDGPGPILAGKEFFAVHPGMKASFFEKVVKCFDSDYVLDGIGEKNSFAACGEEANVALGIGSEGTDRLDIDAKAFGEALPKDFDDVLGTGAIGGLVHLAFSLVGRMVPRPGMLTRFPRRSFASRLVTNWSSWSAATAGGQPVDAAILSSSSGVFMFIPELVKG